MSTTTDIDDINQVSEAVEFVYEIGRVLAQMWTASGDMTNTQAVVVHVLRHSLHEQPDGNWQMKYEFQDPNLDVLSGEDWEEVAMIAAQVEHHAVKSWLEDVLWQEKVGDAQFEHAKAAIEAYSKLCGDVCSHPRNRKNAARRLADLVLSTNQPRETAAGVIEQTIHELLDVPAQDEERSAGDVSALVGAWASLKHSPTTQPDPLSAAEHATDDPHVLRSLADIRHKYSDTPAADDYTKAIDAFLARGELGDSSHKATFYGQALKLAERVQHAKAVSIRVALQQHDSLADVDPLRTESPIPQAEVGRVARQIVGSDNPHAALKRLASALMPLGKHAVPPFNGGIGDIIRTQILGPHGSVIREIEQGGGSITAHRDATTQTIWVYFVPSLQRIFENYQPTKNELRQIFQEHEHISTAAVDTLAEGLALFGEARYEPSANSVLPRLEQILRNIAVKANVKITKDPQGDKRGGVIGFGEVLSRLLEADPPEFPAELASQLQFFLTDDLGFNLRNDVLHALWQIDNTPVTDWHATVIIASLVAVIHSHEVDQAESATRSARPTI